MQHHIWHVAVTDPVDAVNTALNYCIHTEPPPPTTYKNTCRAVY